MRWARDPASGPVYAELLLGGATELDDEGEASRDFVAIESRFGSGSRWWLSQRAEIDLNRDWREEVAGSSSQVTNAAFACSQVKIQGSFEGTAPTSRSPLSDWAITLGRIRLPLSVGTHRGTRPFTYATHVFVVPKSMPRVRMRGSGREALC